MKKSKFIFFNLLCLIAFSIMSLTVYASETDISLDKNIINVNAGDNFSISILGDNSTLRQVTSIASFDSTAISFVNAENGIAAPNIYDSKSYGICNENDSGKIYVSRSSVNKTTSLGSSYGEFVKINFKVSEKAKTNKYLINFYGNKDDSPEFIMNDESQTPFYRVVNSTTMQSYSNFVVEVNVTGSSTEEPVASSYSANIATDKTTYNVGDTVKLTAALTPAQAASLASGSMKISYDKDALDFSGAVSANDIIRATAENGTAVASFTTEADKALSVSKDTPVELATFSFTAKKAGTADFEVTEAIADESVDGALKSAVVNKPESKTTVTIEAVKATCDSYGSDYKLVKYVSDSLPQEGKAYAIGGSVLSYVPAYSTGDNAGKYVFVGLVTEKPADLTVSEVDGDYDTIQATGDANGDKATNITDAQTVIYMIASKITSASGGAYDWLNSDVNGDGVINALDAQAIQYFVHYGEFGQFN